VTWLSSLPAWVILAGSMLFFLAASYLVRLWIRFSIARSNAASEIESSWNEGGFSHKIAGSMMSGLCAIFGIIAAVTLIAQLENWSNAQSAVNAEVSSAARLAVSVSGLPGGERVQRTLTTFLIADKKYEWDSGLDRPARPIIKATLRKLDSETRGVANSSRTTPQAGTEILISLDEMLQARRSRLDTQGSQLPDMFVFALLLSALAVVVNGAVMTTARPKTDHSVIMLTVVMAFDVALVIMLWNPFVGALAISYQRYYGVLSDLANGFFR
jgi:hypothetical protein